MQDVKVAAVQFAPVRADTQANLAKIADLTGKAARAGAEIVCFPEGCISGYGLWDLGPTPEATRQATAEAGRVIPAWQRPGPDLYALAERVPEGPSTQCLIQIASAHNVVVLAGTVELRGETDFLNTYVIVSPAGFVGKYSKTHCIPGLESAFFRQGDVLPVFDLGKVRVGVLICYDNHHPEAHRVLALKGAQAIIMPHVTVGKGWWPGVPLNEAQRQAKNWILTWLRARAFDNSVFAVFANQVSDEGEPLGCSMILDPDGNVLAESNVIGEDVVVAELSARKFREVRARIHAYLGKRRPDLYGELTRADGALP